MSLRHLRGLKLEMDVYRPGVRGQLMLWYAYMGEDGKGDRPVI